MVLCRGNPLGDNIHLIGSDTVAKAAADGYTLVLSNVASHAIGAAVYTKMPYDPIKDFTHIGLIAGVPSGIAVAANGPYTSMEALLAKARTAPGAARFGSNGNGTSSHVKLVILNRAAKGDITHIPYKGSVASTQAVLANDVAYTFSSMPPALSNVKAGKLVALGVTSLKRVASAKNVPTVSEAGIPGFDFDLYSGVLGPKGMPDALIQKIHYELGVAVRSPEMQAIFETIGAEPMTNSSKEFLIHNTNEIAKLVKVVKAAKIQVN